MRVQDVVNAVENTLIEEGVPAGIQEQILDCVYDILRDELGDGDDD